MAYQSCDVLLLTASYGTGHSQVARALSCALQRLEPGINVTILDYASFLDPFLEHFTRIGYYNSIRHFPLGYQLYYHATDSMNPDSFWQRRLNRMGLPRFLTALEELRPKVIASSFPLPAGVVSQLKGSGEINVPVITAITDFVSHTQWIHPHTDAYLVASVEVAEALHHRGVSPSKVHVTGIPILPEYTEPVEKSEARRRLGLEPDRKTVLLMGGGDGIFGLDPLALINKGTPAYQGIILTGKNRELYEKFSVIRDNSTNWRVLGELTDAVLPMCAADLLVTKPGGITISEALSLALPMILARPLPGQERENTNYLKKRHAALVSRDPEQLRATIHRLLQDDLFRKLLSANAKHLGHADSSFRGAEVILARMDQARQKNRPVLTHVRREYRG